MQWDSTRAFAIRNLGSAIEEPKSDWWNQICMEFVFSGETSADETVSWAGVNQSLEGMVSDIIRVKWYYEGVLKDRFWVSSDFGMLGLMGLGFNLCVVPAL